MRELALETQTLPGITSRDAVTLAVKLWFCLAAVGHFIFLFYILAVFYPPIIREGLEGMAGLHLPAGFREGDTFGNLASASHVLLAAIIIGGGPLQLIPAVRQHFPRFHHWLGRAYLLAAVLGAVGGLVMVWTRGTVGNIVSYLTISGDALLILTCAPLAVRHAMARRFAEHRRWALRLFLVASAVWFFRVGLMAWMALTGGVGIDFESFTGPFLYFLGFAQYLLPLAMLQWYFRCAGPVGDGERYAFVGTLLALTLVMCVGIFSATMGMWLPRMA
jgi:hypothetical protein